MDPDPDPGGPKTRGSGGSGSGFGSGSATLQLKIHHQLCILKKFKNNNPTGEILNNKMKKHS
jgi:hypothetical protein